LGRAAAAPPAPPPPPLTHCCAAAAADAAPEGTFPAAARDGKLDPVIGRDDEIRRCIQILSRRTKNNPVLIGEPGAQLTAADGS
jgi:ATP-dependent Clp protease ATP-binding subunit ClpA